MPHDGMLFWRPGKERREGLAVVAELRVAHRGRCDIPRLPDSWPLSKLAEHPLGTLHDLVENYHWPKDAIRRLVFIAWKVGGRP